ncbi:MAG: chlorohydrolase [Methanosarcinales archaeon]|nr:MAG: chlorohydrolase [Methanosarcinales archaeon]
MKEYLLSGSILCGDNFEVVEGYIHIRNGVITEVCEEPGYVDARAHGIIMPCFVNAHTHIGDSVLKDPQVTDLTSLVQPPDGLKHRVLRTTSMRDLVQAMRASTYDMAATGTCAFADFREGGLCGVQALQQAASSAPVDAVIFGRPTGSNSGDQVYGSDNTDRSCATDLEDEIGSILSCADGIGISSTSDYEDGVSAAIAECTTKYGGRFAIHAGELNSTDIMDALALTPDLLIHLTHASNDDLRRVADHDIPVVVCLQSNLLTRVGVPPVEAMFAENMTVAAGTDNVMFNSVDMFAEMRFLSSVFALSEQQVLGMCTRSGALALGLNCGTIKTGADAKVMVLDKDSYNLMGARNILRSVVRRARAGDVLFCSGGA